MTRRKEKSKARALLPQIDRRTLTQLDGQWPLPDDNDSPLIYKIHELRDVEFCKLSIDNLALLIRQQEGLNHIVPISLEILDEDPLVEGLYYPGVLLAAVLKIKDDEWWKSHNSWLRRTCEAFELADRIWTRRVHRDAYYLKSKDEDEQWSGWRDRYDHLCSLVP